jgi:ABC-type polysaccharide/polyol phosphate export permease
MESIHHTAPTLIIQPTKGRYRQMALGPLWIVLRPLFTMVLFTLIFGTVAKLPSDGVPYPIFTYTALLPWTFFSGAVIGASNSLLAYRHLITKVYFPRLIIPVVSILSGLVDFCISLCHFIRDDGVLWVYSGLGDCHIANLYADRHCDNAHRWSLVCHRDWPAA